MRIKYLKLAQDEIIAGERLKMAKQNLKHSYKERNLTISQFNPHQRQEWDKSEFNPDKRGEETEVYRDQQYFPK